MPLTMEQKERLLALPPEEKIRILNTLRKMQIETGQMAAKVVAEIIAKRESLEATQKKTLPTETVNKSK